MNRHVWSKEHRQDDVILALIFTVLAGLTLWGMHSCLQLMGVLT